MSNLKINSQQFINEYEEAMRNARDRMLKSKNDDEYELNSKMYIEYSKLMSILVKDREQEDIERAKLEETIRKNDEELKLKQQEIDNNKRNGKINGIATIGKVLLGAGFVLGTSAAAYKLEKKDEIATSPTAKNLLKEGSRTGFNWLK